MSVEFLAHVARRIWRGYDDPGLPMGMYVAQGAVTGDASGGQASVVFEFRDAASRSGLFFNIEQLECFHSATTTQNIALVATNWDRVSAVGLINKTWKGQLTNNGNGVAALSAITNFRTPIFLGITSPVAELPSNVGLFMANVDLTSFVVTMQGYIWGPRSVMSEGGLRRPVDSLFGGGGN